MDLSFHQPPGAVFLSIPPAPLNFKMLLLHVSMSVFMALMYFVRGHAFFLGTKETPNHIEIGRGGSESPPRNKFVHAEKKYSWIVALGESNSSGWWFSHPSEKYEFVNWHD